MKLLRYILVNGSFAACLWFGVVEHIDGLKNVGLAIAWMTFALSIIILLGISVVAEREPSRLFDMTGIKPVPMAVDYTFDVIVLLFLFYHGFFVTGAAYAFSVFFAFIAFSKIEDAKKSKPE